MLQGIKFAKKDGDSTVPATKTLDDEKKLAIQGALERDLNSSSKKRWQKETSKNERYNKNAEEELKVTRDKQEGHYSYNHSERGERRVTDEPQREDPLKLCDEALDMFLRGSFSRLDRQLEKLEHIKTTNVRNILNKMDNLMIQTKQDDFNERFREEMAGSFGLMGPEGDEEQLSDIEDLRNQQIAQAKSKFEQQHGFKSQLSSNNIDHETHKEMLIQRRNLMMKIRQNDSEFQKYDFKYENYDGQLIEKKLRRGQEERYQKREDKRLQKQVSKHQRVLNKCQQCFYQDAKFERDFVIHESENWYLAFPMRTAPLLPDGAEPVSHVILCTKQHYVNLLEVEENIQDELRVFQKSLANFFKESHHMQVVFIETSIQTETYLPHLQIDCIGIPEDQAMEFDLEVFFKKSLLDDDSEWSTHKKLIDTKTQQGKIWRCLPSSGQFNYIHIDFGAQGGFAHIIEDTRKYNQKKALEVVASAIGSNDLINLSFPMRKDKVYSFAQAIRKKVVPFLDKGFSK